MLKKFFKAGIGGAISQVIILLSLPLLGRIYDLEHFAVWGLVFATTAIISSISCLRYELAIVIPKSEKEAAFLFYLCNSLVMVFSVFSFLLILFFPSIRHMLDGGFDEIFSRLLYLLPLLILLTGINLVVRYWNTRQKNFILISLGQVFMALGTVGSQIGYSILYPHSPSGLVFGPLVGQVMAISIMGLGGQILKTNPAFRIVSFSYFKEVISRHYRFLYYSTPFTVFGALREHATVLILKGFVLAGPLGTYFFTYRLMRSPVALISSAVRPVLFQATAELGVKNTEDKITRILQVITLLTIPLLVLYCFHHDYIFLLVFGDKWPDAGILGLFFIGPVFTFMLCNWMDRILDVLNQQKLALTMEIIFATASLLGLWAGLTLFDDWFVALGIQSAVLVVYNLTYLVVAYKVSSFNLGSLNSILWRSLAQGAACALILLVLGHFLESILVLILYCSIIYSVLGIWMLKRGNKAA